VACGTATYGRRVATPERTVWGIDLSTGMLRQGLRYLVKDHITNVYLARANVMRVPFPPGVFDGIICAGSLHLFPNPVAALKEVRQTLKPGAPLALQTFLPQPEKKKPSIKQRTGFHEFQPDELLACLAEAGFGDCNPTIRGTVIMVAACNM